MNPVKLIIVCAAFCIGASNLAQAQPPSQAIRSAGVTFSAPKSWLVEDLAKQRGVLLMAPQAEANWQANIFLELREDKEGRVLDRALADLSQNLVIRKKGYRELKRSIKLNTKGLQYGLLEYSHQESGAELIEWEIIVPLQGTSRLFILTSTARSVEQKYTPVFQEFLNSLSAPQ